MSVSTRNFRINEIFSKPRIMFGEIIRNNVRAELDSILIMFKFWRENHGGVIISGGRLFSADEVINDYQLVSDVLDRASALSEIRECRYRTLELREKYGDIVESVIFTTNMLDG